MTTMATTRLPVTIEPEADALIDERGVREVFEEIMAQLPESFPDLQGVTVFRLEDHSGDMDGPRIGLGAHRPGADPEDVSLDWAWYRWFGGRYPVEVLLCFNLWPIFGRLEDGR